jgi:hypothetical protein
MVFLLSVELSFALAVPSSRLPVPVSGREKAEHLLLKEGRVKVGTVNGHMAQRAGLEQAGLIVERRHTRRTTETRCRMASEAEQIDIAQLQHVCVRSAVDGMAGNTAIHFDGCMLIDEGSLLVRVAFKADSVLRCGSAYLLGLYRAVHVMAIAALDESFIYPMMERHIELGFLLKMTRVAQLRLGLHKQKFAFFGVMGRMTGDATYIAFRMLRIDGIHVLCAAGVASKAASIDFLG